MRDSLTAFVALRGESLEAFRAALLRAFNPAQGELFTDRPPVQVLPATHVATACAVCPECFEAYSAAFNRAVSTAYETVMPLNRKRVREAEKTFKEWAESAPNVSDVTFEILPLHGKPHGNENQNPPLQMRAGLHVPHHEPSRARR